MTNQATKLPRSAVTLLVVVLFLGACAGGSKLRLSDAAIAGDPSAMWEDGQQSVQTGEALISKGEKLLQEGRNQIRDGEAQIDAGNQRVRQARQDYQDAVLSAGGSTAPKADRAEAQRLRVIGKRWEDAIEEIKEGNRLVDLGNKNIDKGQKEIREGRQLLEEGSILMRNSHRSRLGDTLLPMPKSNR